MFCSLSLASLSASSRRHRLIHRCLLLLALGAFTLPAMAGYFRAAFLQPLSYNAGSSLVGTATATQTAYINVAVASTAGHANQIVFRTQGITTPSDFALVSTTCSASTQYAALQTCTVLYTFTPSQVGQRVGAVLMLDATTGAVLGSSYLTGTGTGPQLTFAPALTSVTGGLLSPQGIAVDGAGNLYVADETNNRIVKETPAAGGTYTQTNLFTVPAPQGIAIDGAGNLYFTEHASPYVTVATLGATGYTLSTIGSGLASPGGLTVDTNGVVWVADTYNYRVIYLVPSPFGPVQYTLESGSTLVAGVAVDLAGNVYLADTGGLQVFKYTLQSNGTYSSPAPYGNTELPPTSIAADRFGNIYYGDQFHVVKVTNNGLTQTQIIAGVASPAGLAIDSAGNVFASDTGNNRIQKYDIGDASPLTFASSAVGVTSTDSPKNVTIINSGTTTLTISQIATSTSSFITSAGCMIALYSGYCYSPDPTCIASLAPLGTCAFAVSFKPAASGALTDTAVITSNAHNSPVSVALSGTATNSGIVATVTVSPVTVQYGATASLTATVTYSSSTNIPTGPFSFSINGSPTTAGCYSGGGFFGTSSVLTSPFTCTLSIGNSANLGVGQYTLAATLAADSNFASATGSSTFTVTPVATFLNLSIAGHTYGDAPFAVSASSNSPATITYGIASGPATISGNIVTITAAGSVSVTASQPAAGNYVGASTGASFAVSPKALSASITGTPTKPYDGTTSATIPAGAIQLTGLAGTDSITVTPPAGTYAAAAAGSQTVTAHLTAANYTAVAGSLSNYSLPSTATGPGLITPSAPTVGLSIGNHTYGDAPFALAATSNASGATFTYAVTSGPATVSGSLLTITGAGAVNVTVTSPAIGNYTQGSGTASFTAAQQAQTITFTGLPATATLGAAGPYTLAASSTSGLTVTYSVSGPATLAGSTLTLTGPGTVSVVAAQIGNANYLAATSVTQTIVVQQNVSAPVFSPAAGSYAAGQMIMLSDPTAGAAITYQINGGPVMTYSAPFALSATATVVATASLNSGAVVSPATSATYSIVSSVPAPSILPAGGTYTANQTVTISDTTAGTTIYYTVNGGGQILYSGPFLVTASESIQSVAILSGVTSAISSATYNLVTSVAAPVASPAGGSTTYPTGQQVALSSTTSGATIYYSVNSGGYQVYSSPITLATSETLHFYSTYSSLTSGTVAATYSVASAIAAPIITPGTGTYPSGTMVNISETTGGTTIYYTLDNGTSHVYTGPFALTNTTLVRASAVDVNNNTSAIASATISITSGVASPVFSLPAGPYSGTQTLTLTEPTAGATVYYSTDNVNFAVYTGPITIAASETVYAGASLSGVYAAGSSATYTITP